MKSHKKQKNIKDIFSRALVVVPGFGVDLKTLKKCERFLKKLGFENSISPSLLGKDLLFSHNLKARVKSFKGALDKGGLLWCLRGGYGSVQILPFLKKTPPARKSLLLGYSDVTALHCFFHEVWGWSTLHGPLLDGASDKTVSAVYFKKLLDVLLRNKEEVSYSLSPMNQEARKNKILKGKIKGGNLSVIQTLIKTPYEPSLSGCFLFLEDVGETGYQVHRMLTHLEQAGLLKNVKAILLGSFLVNKKDEPLLKKVLKKWAEDQVIPVFGNLPVGHGKKQAPLPLNTPSYIQNKKLFSQVPKL